MTQLLFALASERPLISFDGTLVVNIVLWLVLFVLLRPLLWEPMIKLFSAREGGMGGSRDEAKRLEAEAKTKREEYEAKLKAARTAAASERDRVKSEALKREAEIVGAARNKVAEAVEAQRATLRTEREKLAAELKTMIPGLAKDIASKALGREVAS
jgi:F-type H+-transporting ATPase subunit b